MPHRRHGVKPERKSPANKLSQGHASEHIRGDPEGTGFDRVADLTNRMAVMRPEAIERTVKRNEGWLGKEETEGIVRGLAEKGEAERAWKVRQHTKM